jgi:excisionase family DNA binding protein
LQNWTVLPWKRGRAMASTTAVSRKTSDDSVRQIPKFLLTRDEAAWSLGISLRTLSTMVARGDINPVRLGGKTLFRPADLNECVEATVQDLG